MRAKLIALAALVGGQATPVSAQPLIRIPQRPQIVVGGYGEVKTMPDIATITYTARGEGPTSDDAVRAMAAAEARISDAVHAIDGTAQPQTSEVKVAAVRSDDCKEREYGPVELSTGACAISGYVATQSATVRTAAVNDAGTMVGLISRAGAMDPTISSFDLHDPRTAQQQATAAALSDAASKAATIATASHVQLGPILNIATAAQNQLQAIIVTGSHDLKNAPPPAPPPVTVKLMPEPITTNANVTVTYAIGQ
jgi:uncharacterized protein YggE